MLVAIRYYVSWFLGGGERLFVKDSPHDMTSDGCQSAGSRGLVVKFVEGDLEGSALGKASAFPSSNPNCGRSMLH